MIEFYKDSEIVLINTSEIIGIVRRALSKIDPRLIDHGERVGYIALKICEHCGQCAEIDLSRLFILCVLHDIGAYKTEEIDNMVQFEVDSVFDHSLYGYLFLKSTNHLSQFADALLYHHTDYTSPLLQTCNCSKYAQLIHLADRVDVLLSSGSSDLSQLRQLSGTQF